MTVNWDEVERLVGSRQALRAAHVAFTQPNKIVIERDNGERTEHLGPSLWMQLLGAVATGSERRTGTGRSSSRTLLIAAHAVDLKVAIEQDTRHWSDARDVSERIERGVRIALRVADPGVLDGMTGALARWSQAVTNLLNPPLRMHIANACPVCDVSTVLQYDVTHGEDLLVPALQVMLTVDGIPQCVCLHCRALWTGDVELQALATEMGLGA